MNNYYGANFIFDSIPSELYGMKILDFNTGGQLSQGSSGNETEIIQEWTYKRTKPYFFGTTQNRPLTIDMSIGDETFFYAKDREKILKWLLGKNEYKKLQIVQDDLESVYYNVIFTGSENLYAGKKQIGFILHGTCDAPWGFEFPKSIAYTFATESIQDFDFNFFNDSDNNGYLYPEIDFSLNSLGSDFTITNYSDGNREFEFLGLLPNESIYVNNDLKIIESSGSLMRLSKFNKNWLRFLPGLNEMHINGGISSVEITYEFARTTGA